MNISCKPKVSLIWRKWKGVAWFFTIGLVLVGCVATDKSTKQSTKQTCGTLLSSGSTLYLENTCNDVREIKIRWRNSSGNDPNPVRYRLGTWANKRVIESGTVGQIVSDIPAPSKGGAEALNDVVIETVANFPEEGQFTLGMHNKSTSYVFVGVRLAEPDASLEKSPITLFVLAPPSIDPRRVPIFNSVGAPGRYRIEIAEYEPR